MKPRNLSASSAKTYLQCALKYYFRYEDKKPRQGKTDALAFGIAIHEAMEKAHELVSERGGAPDAQVYKEVLETFTRSATENNLSDLKRYEEGREMITHRLDNINPEEKILGLELGFELKTDNGTPFVGSIDKLVELDEETAIVVDYKTSYVALTQEEADYDIQMSMYDLAVSMLYPQYKTIVLVLDYTRMGQVLTHRSQEQRNDFINFIDALYQTIINQDGKDVKPNLNRYCGWCDFKQWCPAYAKVVEDPDLILPRIDGLSEQEFVNAWRVVSAAKRIIDGRKDALKMEANNRIRSGGKKIKGKEKEIYKVQTSRINYDPRSVLDVVGIDDFLRMITVNKGAIDKFLLNNPKYKETLEEAASFSFNNPYFKIRKSK